MICTNPRDDFVHEKLRWVVVLSNKDKIFQDDYRPDLEEKSAWLRLKKYLAINDLYIVNMVLQFRSHIIQIGTDKEAYFFCKSVGAWSFGPSFNYYKAGFCQGERVHVTTYQVPELIKIETQCRSLAKCKDFVLPGKNV